MPAGRGRRGRSARRTARRRGRISAYSRRPARSSRRARRRTRRRPCRSSRRTCARGRRPRAAERARTRRPPRRASPRGLVRGDLLVAVDAAVVGLAGVARDGGEHLDDGLGAGRVAVAAVLLVVEPALLPPDADAAAARGAPRAVLRRRRRRTRRGVEAEPEARELAQRVVADAEPRGPGEAQRVQSRRVALVGRVVVGRAGVGAPFTLVPQVAGAAHRAYGVGGVARGVSARRRVARFRDLKKWRRARRRARRLVAARRGRREVG